MVTARDVMTPPTGHLAETDSVVAAAGVMRDLDLSSIPVCDPGGRLTGILTDHDIVRCLGSGWDPATTTAKDAVDGAVLAVPADELVESALLTMALHHVRRLPVVDDGSLVGMLADTDLAQSVPEDALGKLFAHPGR